jgi:hypothetical protein
MGDSEPHLVDGETPFPRYRRQAPTTPSLESPVLLVSLTRSTDGLSSITATSSIGEVRVKSVGGVSRFACTDGGGSCVTIVSSADPAQSAIRQRTSKANKLVPG